MVTASRHRLVTLRKWPKTQWQSQRVSLIHKPQREQTLKLQIAPCYCGESHWELLARPLNSTFCNPPIWRHSRWVKVCDLLRQFCAWLPWPVLVWHLLLLVGLYPDLHTGLLYSCLAGKLKHIHIYTPSDTHTHTCINTLAVPGERQKSLVWFGRDVSGLCVIVSGDRYTRLSGRRKGNTLWWAKGPLWLHVLVLIWSQRWFR